MPKNIKMLWRSLVVAAGVAAVLWTLWESICVLNGWNVLGWQLCYAIPILVVGCGMGWALHRKSERDMSRLFTEEERKEFTQIMQSHVQAQGRNMGFFIAPLCVLSGFLYAFCGRSLLLASLPIVVPLLILLPFRWREGMRFRKRIQLLMDQLKSAARKDDQE
jgi:hypothetical protein